MIRIVQTFTCLHEKPALPVQLKTQGHSISIRKRECYCTGKPVEMERSVAFSDPDAGRPH